MPDEKPANQPQSLEQLSPQEGQMSFFAELWDFLRHNKKWWLLPIIVVLLFFGALVLLSSSAAAPFIYTLF